MARLIDLLTRRGPQEGQPADPATDADPSAEAAGRTLNEVEFAGYSEDCRVFGFLRHGAGRLTDALNEITEYHLDDVMVVALSDGHAVLSKELTVRREEMLAVRATGRRGDPAHRGRTRPYPVTLQTGPFTIHGYLHGLPGADPLVQLRRRAPMVPLTEAWIEYDSAGERHRARVGTIIVNRESLDWIRMSRDEEVGLPDLPAEAALDSRAKDLTGYIHVATD